MRQTMAVACGFVLWSAGWLFYNASLRKFAILPQDETQPIESPRTLFALIIGSGILSLLAGFVAAAISRKSGGIPVLSLALLLLAVGVFFQVQMWRLMPLWYHISFLGMLIPVCLFGAWLHRAS